MIEELFAKYLPIIIHIFELMGIIILIIGAFKAFFHYARSLYTKDTYALKYNFANAMVTSLDFKLAAEILKTVIIKNLDELIIMGAIFFLRAFMTLILEREITMEEKKEDK